MWSKTTEKALLLNLVLFLTSDLGVQTNTKPDIVPMLSGQLCAAKWFLFMSLNTWVLIPKMCNWSDIVWAPLSTWMSLTDCRELKYRCYAKWYSKVLPLIFPLYLMKQFSLIVALEMQISNTNFGTRLEPGAFVAEIPVIFLPFCLYVFGSRWPQGWVLL